MPLKERRGASPQVKNMKKFNLFKTVLLISGLMYFNSCSFDDKDLWNSISDLEQRVETLEEKVTRLNTEIGDIQTIVNALNNGKVITSVVESDEGYTITFNDGNTITVRHGASGANAPIIGVDVFEGVYYWTITANGTSTWLTDKQGAKLPVTGVNKIAVDAEGYWTTNGERITDASGDPVKAGDSLFSSVTQDDNNVTFTLTDGSTFVIPKAGSLSLTIDCGAQLYLLYGESKEYTVTSSGVESYSISKPDGWKASIQNGKFLVTAPSLSNSFAEQNGVISIVAIGKNKTIIYNIEAGVFHSYTIDFEDSRISSYLAGPTSYGENLYNGYPGQYTGYSDPSGLFMMLNESLYSGELEFYGGGIAISQWNDMTTDGSNNQCSVYYRDIRTGKGGYSGSSTFAVAYGNNNPMMLGDARPIISFDDNATECVFDYFYVTNSTYAVLSMENGDPYAKKFTYADKDWFKLVIEGYDKNGVLTGKVDFYLADFRTSSSPGIVKEWKQVNLSSLGKVSTVKFDLQSSDSRTYGMNTPAYFCFDNLAVKLTTLP
jgi:hypothetical protein